MTYRVTVAVYTVPAMSEHHGVLMLHIYGFRRDGGKYYIASAQTIEEGIRMGEDALADRPLGFLRAGQRCISFAPMKWCGSAPPSSGPVERISVPPAINMVEGC